MSQPRSEPQDGNTAFVAAASVLGIVAIAQVAAVAWFVSTYHPGESERSQPAAFQPMATAPQAQPAPLQQATALEPQLSRSHSIANIPTVDPASMTPPPPDRSQGNKEVDEEVAVQNKAALFYLDKGMALRSDGDMQGALVHFNSAASLEKNHPRILYEFAITYEQMRLREKATRFWKSIYEMGPVRGGDYYSLADFRLKGQDPALAVLEEADAITAAGASGAVPAETDIANQMEPLAMAADSEGRPQVPDAQKFLDVVSVIAEPDETVAEGERVVVNILIKASPGTVINPNYVHVRVDFYDVVNESMVDLTRAVPANRWVTQPIDWQDQAEELLEITYYLPPQSDQDILDFGQRAYHGYVIEAFYRDELQDVIAEPRSLLKNARDASDSASPQRKELEWSPR